MQPMRLDDYIAQLQALRTQYGNIDVKCETLIRTWPADRPVIRSTGPKPEQRFVLINP